MDAVGDPRHQRHLPELRLPHLPHEELEQLQRQDGGQDAPHEVEGDGGRGEEGEEGDRRPGLMVVPTAVDHGVGHPDEDEVEEDVEVGEEGDDDVEVDNIITEGALDREETLLELGRRLVSLHGLCVTIFLLSRNTSDANLLCALSPLPDTLVETCISQTLRASIPSLRASLRDASPPPSALVVDIFGTDYFDVARDLRVPAYVFFTSSAALLALLLHSPALDREVTGEYVDLPGPIRVPGCLPIRPADVVDPMLDRTNERYRWYLHHCSRLPLADGILLNTVEEIDRRQIAALREDPAMVGLPTPPLYPVGPVIKSESTTGHPKQQHQCLAWLDLQPPRSVLFVSFGSGGTLSADQTAELAWGLELSGQRFLWVIRRPVGTGDSAAAFFASSKADPDDPAVYLAEGFTKRTEGKGFLLPSWAPQVEILGHPAVGGFLTHGGWNSALESLSLGVALAVWPLYAEQRMNAARLEEELGVAVRVRTTPAGLVRREEVERVTRLLMEEGSEEGKAMRAKAAELRQCFARAVAAGGSSYCSMAAAVGRWRARAGGY